LYDASFNIDNTAITYYYLKLILHSIMIELIIVIVAII
jgi:hypothetical protein